MANKSLTPLPVSARILSSHRAAEDLGRGQLELSPEGAVVTGGGVPVRIAWREVEAVRSEDYALAYGLSSGATIELLRLGGRFDEAVTESLRLWRDEVAVALMIAEPTLHDSFECRFARGRGSDSAGEARLYDTRMGLFPADGLPTVVEYGDVTAVSLDEGSYAVTIDCGETLVLGKLGRRTLELPDVLRGRVSALQGAVQATVARIAPTLGALRVRELSSVFSAGGSLPEGDVPDFAPSLYSALSATLPEAAAGSSYLNALRDLCGGRLRLGVRPASQQAFVGDKATAEELTANNEGEAVATVWALAPLGDGDDVATAAFEVLTEEDRATYLFRIEPGVADQDMRHLERCLLRVQYRREPVALRDEDVVASEYSLAVRQVPELQWLRERFLGRVAHTGVEAWTARLRSLAK